MSFKPKLNRNDDANCENDMELILSLVQNYFIYDLWHYQKTLSLIGYKIVIMLFRRRFLSENFLTVFSNISLVLQFRPEI